MDLTELRKPFPAEDIEWRIGRCGKKGDGAIWAKAFVYITARAIHDRLDDVCGPENWQLEYTEHLGETVCRIGILCNGEWVWKSGGAGKTDVEAFKGGLSSAEKRAGVPWGIGRYLYNLDETWVETSTARKDGWNYQPANQKKDIPAFYWRIPDLPNWALPDGERTPPKKAPQKQEEAKDLPVNEIETGLKACETEQDLKDLMSAWGDTIKKASNKDDIVKMFTARKQEILKAA